VPKVTNVFAGTRGGGQEQQRGPIVVHPGQKKQNKVFHEGRDGNKKKKKKKKKKKRNTHILTRYSLCKTEKTAQTPATYTVPKKRQRNTKLIQVQKRKHTRTDKPHLTTPIKMIPKDQYKRYP